MISLFHGENTGSSPVGRASDFNGLEPDISQNQRLYGKFTQKCFCRRLRLPPSGPVQTICTTRKNYARPDHLFLDNPSPMRLKKTPC